jgi:hypothetical protein
MDQGRSESRIGAIAAMSGAFFLAVGTYLHPSEANPYDATQAFAEYAADNLWVWTHLTQFLGVVLIVGVLVLLSRTMAHGPAAHWADLGTAGAIGSVAVASVLQAVDGVALKIMVNHWVDGTGHDKAILFQAAFAVRQVEIGLASFASIIFGMTVAVYGVALMIDRRYPIWLGALGVVGGISGLAGGVLMAHTGFSEIAMAVSMASNMLLLVWMVSVGFFLWPKPRPGADSPSERLTG